MMSTLTAARSQMGMSLAFHMIFAAMGIGLPAMLVVVEGLYLRTRSPHLRKLAHQWAKVTGLLFAIGAISGTALSFELGLLWPNYMRITGAAVGHIFALEGYAFFIEAIFIGLYLYGWDRMSATAHWLCGVVIAITGAASGWFILGVNAWMQLPVGFTLDPATGNVLVTDPIAIFKEPTWAHMAIHSTLACYVAVGFAIVAVYARAWLRERRADSTRRVAIAVGMAIGGVCAILQPLSGDALAKYVFRTQPAKFAGMEGQFKTEAYAPLRIGGWPDEQLHETRYAIEIPGGLSFLATHDPSAVVTGLDSIPRDRWPNIHGMHVAFQVMVGIGTLLPLLTIWFWLAWWRGGRGDWGDVPKRSRQWLLRALVIAGPLGFIALEAGWMVTELGRQPWAIHGVMLTADAVTPVTAVSPVFFSFTILYIVLAIMVVLLLRAMACATAAEAS